MTLGDLTDFLLPDMGDPLQLGSLLTIVLLLVYTVTMTHRAARPASWEKKWNGGTPDKKDDDLDIEHGSVTDLWNAVATSHEKLAEIMPGLLLVVGLLGTFIGLGMALNNASHLLGQSNAITANSMDDLMHLLNNLGNKFKTSTWGITGFIILKAWSVVTRFDEKRLTWVIGKVKGELEDRKQEQQQAEKNKQDLLFSQFAAMSGGIIAAIASLERKFDEDSAHAKRQDAANALLREICEATAKAGSEMEVFTTGTKKIVQQMADAGKQMAAGSGKVSDAAEGLKQVVDEFGNEFKEVLAGVRDDLGSAIVKMSKESADTLKKGSDELSKATDNISRALDTLSRNVEGTLQQVKDTTEQSLGIQKKIQIEFMVQSQQVMESIEQSNSEQKLTRDSIASGLKSVADTRQHMSKAATALHDVAPLLIERLENVISFKESFQQTNKQLNKTNDTMQSGIEQLTELLEKVVSQPPQSAR